MSEYQQQLDQEGAETQLVYLANREGDLYALFAERERIVQRGEIAADWLIRSKHDRNTEEGEKIRTHVRDFVANAEKMAVFEQHYGYSLLPD